LQLIYYLKNSSKCGIIS